MHSLYANQWTTCAAPDPKAVIWGNLAIPFVQRLVRQTLVYFVVTVMILFYTIPAYLTSYAIISAAFILLKLPEDMPLVNTALPHYLSQLVSLISIFLLPSLLLKLSSFEGIPSKDLRDRAAAGKFFYFNVLNVFLGVTIAIRLLAYLLGIINSQEFITSPQFIISQLSEFVPRQASFFISFVAIK